MARMVSRFMASLRGEGEPSQYHPGRHGFFRWRRAKVTVVVGLPGSGKSHLVDRVRQSCAGVCVEDYHANAHNHSPEITASMHYPALIQALRSGNERVIADVAFTDTWRREELARVISADVAGVTVAWVFFANDLDRCVANIQRRARQTSADEVQLARRLSPRYFIPHGAAVVPVWEPFAESSDAPSTAADGGV
jgi:predicted kinase